MKAAIKVAKPVARKPAGKKTVASKAVATVAKLQPLNLVTRPVVAPAAKAAPTPAKVKTPQSKLAARKPATPKAVSPIVRESFTMTTADQELLKTCKKDALQSGRDSTKKSEIVRAALRHFASLNASTRLMEINGLDPVKTGRPKKQRK